MKPTLPLRSLFDRTGLPKLHGRAALHGDGDLVLPPGFPVRSVGGALNDPNWSSTHIEDYLFELGTARQSELVLSILITHLVRANIPATDLSGLLTTLVITVVFPDGSQMDYAIHYNQNVLKGEAKMELTADGNARMPDGSPAPTSGGSFAGLTIHDHNGSLQEWILWARSLGLIVSGPGNGTTMTCKVVGNEIHCTVVKRP